MKLSFHINYTLFRTQILSRPAMYKGVQFTATVLAFLFGLPVSIALFPQESSIRVRNLEPELQLLAKGEELLYYNKGL